MRRLLGMMMMDGRYTSWSGRICIYCDFRRLVINKSATALEFAGHRITKSWKRLGWEVGKWWDALAGKLEYCL